MKYYYENDTDGIPWQRYIVKTDDAGKELNRWTDNGEPEDNYFTRDYKWVLPELQELASEIEDLQRELIYK